MVNVNQTCQIHKKIRKYHFSFTNNIPIKLIENVFKSTVRKTSLMQGNNKDQADRQAVILFADDDELCLDVGVKMLQKLGYTVLNARDGKEALDVFIKNQNIVDLVILDMKMPHNGGTTFEQIKKINADINDHR